MLDFQKKNFYGLAIIRSDLNPAETIDHPAEAGYPPTLCLDFTGAFIKQKSQSNLAGKPVKTYRKAKQKTDILPSQVLGWLSVALRYEAKTMDAPVVVAKGAGHLAEKIREIARAYGVPIVRKPELARTIYATVEPGRSIPESLYVAVAEVLAMIYRLRRRK